MSTSSPRKRSGGGDKKEKNLNHQKTKVKVVGAWVPWHIVEKVCGLNLRPSSVWQVYLAVLLTSMRYRGAPARLGVKELAKMTGLASRTVKRALAKLLKMGLLVRPTRVGQLQVAVDPAQDAMGDANNPAPPDPQPTSTRGANNVALRGCHIVGTSPTCLYVSSIKNLISKGPFSAKQQAVIADVLAEASELLGADATRLPLSAEHAARLSVALGTTYGQALDEIVNSSNKTSARDFTKAVLALRRDPRVQGEELDPKG